MTDEKMTRAEVIQRSIDVELKRLRQSYDSELLALGLLVHVGQLLKRLKAAGIVTEQRIAEVYAASYEDAVAPLDGEVKIGTANGAAPIAKRDLN